MFWGVWALAVVLSLVVGCGDNNGSNSSSSRTSYQLDWINFGPYLEGQNPNLGVTVPEQQLRDRLKIIAPYVKGLRSFGSTQGLENLARIAKQEFGLKTAIGAWLSTNTAANEQEMNNLIAAARAGYVDIAIIGSEVLSRNDLSETNLLNYLARFRAAVPGVPVTTAEVYGVLAAHPNLMAACDVIFANYYPYWEGINVNDAVALVYVDHLSLIARVGGKQVYVSETGWPSEGNTINNAVANASNANYYFNDIASWARQQNIQLIYFEAFDEPWKADYEGPQGAHWGIFTKDGVMKPGRQDVFDGKTLPDDWSCKVPVGGAGTPAIAFTLVPPKGSTNDLQGQVRHVIAKNYAVAVYIKVGSGWWTKPLWVQPKTSISCTGSWTCDITTGGIDTTASEIAAYLIPATYDPPLANGGALLEAELLTRAVVSVKVTR